MIGIVLIYKRIFELSKNHITLKHYSEYKIYLTNKFYVLPDYRIILKMFQVYEFIIRSLEVDEMTKIQIV